MSSPSQFPVWTQVLGSVENRGRRPARCWRAFTLVEILAVVTILGVVICAVTQIYTTGLSRWIIIYGRGAALLHVNTAIDRMNRDLTRAIALVPEWAGANPVYTLILPRDTDVNGNEMPISTASGLLYANGARVRYYLSDNTGGLAVTGGNLLWRATAPNGSAAFTPDIAWSLPNGHPLCSGVTAFAMAALNRSDSAAIWVQLTAKIIDGGKATSCTAARTVALPCSNASLLTFSIDPRATFLMASNDPNALLPRVVDLQALTIAPGDRIRIEPIGAYAQAPGSPDTSTLSNFVFSSSSTVQAYSLLNRVANPLTSNGPAYLSPPTRFGGQQTDITQDFWADGSHAAVVTVPARSQFLMIGVPDSFNGNHNDPNGDFAIRITKLTP